MNIGKLFYDYSKANEHYSRTEFQPKQFSVWLSCLLFVIAITFLKPVQKITGLYPVKAALILSPHFLLCVWMAVRVWTKPFNAKLYLRWTMFTIHINFMVIAGLICSAGEHPWTPLWAAYLFYVAVILNAQGFQLYFMILIGVGGMLPWAFYTFTYSSLADSYLPVCITFSTLGLIQYLFIGTVVTGSRKLQILEEQLAYERNLTEEIQRIWREIHDGVGSHLTMAIMGNRIAVDSLKGEDSRILKTREMIDGSTENLNKAIAEIRETAYLTRKMGEWTIDGLISHFRQIFSAAFESKNMKFSITFTDSADFSPVLRPNIVHSISRIVQESLTNIIRHSDATEAMISIVRTNTETAIKISDNGTLGKNCDRRSGSGIEFMHKRAEQIGGNLNLAVTEYGGVEITLRLAGKLMS